MSKITSMKITPIYKSFWYKRNRTSDGETRRAKRIVEQSHNLSGSVRNKWSGQ